MLTLDHMQYRARDVVQAPCGATLSIRAAEPDDARAVNRYFMGLSQQSRYSRFMGALKELSPVELDHAVRADEGRYPLLATVRRDDGREVVVGEARCVIDETGTHCEVALSICDQARGRGFGAVLLANLVDRAAASGVQTVFGDTLRSNDAMIATARKLGFDIGPVPGDWRQVRFTKLLDVDVEEIAAGHGQVRPAAAMPVMKAAMRP